MVVRLDPVAVIYFHVVRNCSVKTEPDEPMRVHMQTSTAAAPDAKLKVPGPNYPLGTNRCDWRRAERRSATAQGVAPYFAVAVDPEFARKHEPISLRFVVSPFHGPTISPIAPYDGAWS